MRMDRYAVAAIPPILKPGKKQNGYPIVDAAMPAYSTGWMQPAY